MNKYNWFKNKVLKAFLYIQKSIIAPTSSKNYLAPLSFKNFLIFSYDIVMAFFSLFFAIYLKIGSDFLDFSSPFLIKNFFVFLLIFSGISTITKPYKTLWKNISNKEFTKVTTTSVMANILFLPAMFLISLEDESFPTIVPIINIFVLICLMVSPRIIMKIYYDYKTRKEQLKKDYAPILLVGKNNNIEHFINEIPHISDFPYRILGIILTENTEEEQEINEHEVLGQLSNMENIFLKLKKENKLPPFIMLVDETLEGKKHKSFIKKAQEYKMIVLKTMHKLSFSIVSVDNKAS